MCDSDNSVTFFHLWQECDIFKALQACALPYNSTAIQVIFNINNAPRILNILVLSKNHGIENQGLKGPQEFL